MDLFGGLTFKAVERGLDGSQLKQKAISQNIANVDTPNYKATNVTFKQTLTDTLNSITLQANRTNEQHVEFSRKPNLPHVEKNKNTAYNHNGNNVDIDLEMAELAKNQIYYNALIDRLNGSFNNLQTVIRGGR